MSQLDDLLSRSRAPGAFVERRAFTLSRAKAIEKQRAFALRLPHQYVLELIQAALFAGATYVAVDTRPESLLVAWVGAPPLEPDALAELLDYLFADRTRAETRHLVQLAVGVNALLQERPRLIRIESGDGADSVRVDLDHEGNGSVGEAANPIAGTYLYIEFALGLFGRWRTRRHVEEQRLVEERCLYTPVPILLNGAAPFGYRGSRHIEIFGARRQEHFDEGGRRGVIALHTNPRAPTGFRVVVGGVWIATLPLEELATQPLVGVVCDDNLRKTADHADIVLDHRYVELLHAVQPHATALMGQVVPGTYSPPRLPPVPHAEPDADTPRSESAGAEPLPDVVPMFGAWGSTTLDRLDGLADLVFYAPPSRAAELGVAADPARFPWPVLLLTDGQATTLRARLPRLQLHRVTSASDLDFVRRMAEQRAAPERVEVTTPDGVQVALTLHRDRPPPPWGAGEPGVPLAVVAGGRTVTLGAIDGRTIRIVGAQPEALEVGLHLPDCSLVITLPRELPSGALPTLLDAAHVERVLEAALAFADHPRLLLALLGQVARPTFGDAGVALHLPVGWSPDLLRRPVLSGASPLDLAALAGLDAWLTLPRDADPTEAELLEARVGFGHLTHPSLLGVAVAGVVRIGDRWVIGAPSLLDAPRAEAALVVTATLDPTPPPRWGLARRVAPGLVGWTSGRPRPIDWDEAGGVLLDRLVELDADEAWGRLATEVVSAARAADRGRLALLQLATHRRRADLLGELGDDVRVVARGGPEVGDDRARAWTADERAAVDPERRLRPLHDDPPERWASLATGGPGWLVRREVQGELRGWLGLSIPHDPTCAVFLRSILDFVSLPELQDESPCHGLVVPTDAAGPMSHHLLRLEGLKLYQALADRLELGAFEPAERAAAEAWAFTFAAKAWTRTGSLTGLAATLAARVPIPIATGTWGSAHQWLTASPGARPPLPEGWIAPTPPRPLLPVAVESGTRWLTERLGAAIAPLRLTVHQARRDGRAPVRLVPERSHRQGVTLLLDSDHPLVQAAGQGRRVARELLLLEAARVAVRHNRWIGQPGLLVDIQQALLASRAD